ncbi:hypothetical protein E1258_03635 [Micromonospora sp. KC207]|uniref:hypothetical protein n=1 Tax=Micromonospora sp. KC207 TaxID=2530377 RepID=UPI001053B190|nr:hypothetical protein [Micromonospora sp. KC207]TDC66072.1 hypothetical protein E1258_03635 [Micromonospora sp. KC207]
MELHDDRFDADVAQCARRHRVGRGSQPGEDRPHRTTTVLQAILILQMSKQAAMRDEKGPMDVNG